MTTEVQPPPAPPSAAKVALSGAVGLALGLGLVAWSMGTERPVADPEEMAASTREAGSGDRNSEFGDRNSESGSGSEPAAESESESAAASESESAAESESESEPAAASESAAESEPESESAAESEPEPEPEPEAETPAVPATAAAGTPGSTTFERVRVAFLRCGEPEVRCGRDRDFEEAAWAILAELPSCAALAGRVGSADVRVHRTGGGNELRFRDWGDAPIPTGALQGCLESSGLSDLPISVDGSPLIVSFRFQLR